MKPLIDHFILEDKYHRKLELTEYLVKAFGELSGDYNPLHTDKVFSETKGFRDTVVYGNILGLLVSSLVGESLPVKEVMLLGQKIDYRKPMFIGETIHLEGKVSHVSEGTGMVELKLTFRREGELVASGSCSFKCLET